MTYRIFYNDGNKVEVSEKPCKSLDGVTERTIKISCENNPEFLEQISRILRQKFQQARL